MKKLGLLFATVVMLMLFAVSASAETEGIYTYDVYNNEARITDVSFTTIGSVTIPSTLGGYSVTSIGSHAFEGCKYITSVVIPDSVTSIGQSAFEECKRLKSITIPDSVTSMGSYVFYHCESLTSVTLPNSITGINDTTFCECGSLTNIIIPDSVTYIGGWAFWGCLKLTSITIPAGVTSIDYKAFGNCPSLTSITVDAANEYYSNDSHGVLFDKDKTVLIQYPIGNSRSSYAIPDGVITIGDDAFNYCNNLTSVIIPDSVTSIGGYAFNSCDNLTDIIIPDGVTSIGDNAFSYCPSLKSIRIPASVTSIGTPLQRSCSAFASCSSLTSITVDTDNKYYSSDSHGVLFDKDKTVLLYYPDGNTSSSYVIPEGVTSICNSAFASSKNLTSVVIPEGVTSIGDYAFAVCENLISITIPGSLTSVGYAVFQRKINDVYYGGTAQQWENLILSNMDKRVREGRIHFSSTQMNHPYLATIIPPACESDGYTTYTCACGYSYESDIIEATGHKYDGQNCEICGKSCSCKCHKTGISNFFWKISNFFNKLFKVKKKQMCACGIAHF